MISTILINLSTFMHNFSTIPIITQMRAAAKRVQPIYTTAAILFFSLLQCLRMAEIQHLSFERNILI